MNPLDSVFGRAFQIVLIPDKKLEVNCGLQDLVLLVLTSAVTPSLDEGAPLILLLIVG
jgi:hypothetical protein